MKSKMKKLVSLVLAMAMVLTMSLAVYADEEESGSTETTTYTITINNTTAGHTYEAYQIFDGDLSSKKDEDDVTTYTLSNIVWGSGVDYTNTVGEGDDAKTLLEAVKAISVGETTPFADCEDAAAVAEILKNYSDNPDAVNAFAEAVAPYLVSKNAVTSTCNEDESENVENYTISITDPGYYLVKDQDESLLSETNDAYTSYILEVVADAEVEPKSSVPSMTKKVQDANDSTDATDTVNAWQDSADYDIGDDVPFQLTATMPSTLSSYDTYSITFHDTMDGGLSFNSDSVEVYVGDTKVSSSCYTVKTTGLSDTTCTFEIAFDDVRALVDESSNSIEVSANTQIVVTYTAKLTGEAVVIGNSGNWNTAYLEYSNNPYTEGTGKTPTDTVVVLTYDLTINKVNGDEEPLSGAEFSLTKYNKVSGTWETVTLTKSEDGTSFTAEGLDDGVYKLSETKTPTGYNSIDDIYFIVSAEHTTTIEEKNSAPLTSLTVTQATWDGESATAAAVGEADATATFNTTLTPAEDATLIATSIKNQSGSILPSTGGIGTTIFYIVGAILVLGAGVILVTRRRTAR